MADITTPFDIEDDLPWSSPSPSVATRRPSARSSGSARVTVVSPSRMLVPDQDDAAGGATCAPMRCVEVLTESDTEAKAAYALLAHPDIVGLREQPEAVTYHDEDGVARHHTLEFIAIHRDGTRTAVLVKNKAAAERKNMEDFARHLAKSVSNRVADRFLLLTEDDLDADRVHDAKLINAARLHPRPAHDEIVLGHARSANGEITVVALMNLAGLGGSGFRSIARLIGAGRIAKLDHGRLSHASLVAIVDGKPGIRS